MYPPQLEVLAFFAVAIVVMVVASRLSARRWLRWTERAADYGTREILNARHIDSDEAVGELRARFEAWSMVVAGNATRFCEEDDALGVQFFEVPMSADVEGFNDEHRYIRRATAERVRRLIDLAARLEHGKTQLRARWVPRVS